MHESDIIASDVFHELVKRISNHSLQLASLPDIVIKVNQVLDDDRKGVIDVAKIIQKEVALSTRIMQIANSPSIRSSKQITSIVDAINRLGMDLVKNLAICVSLNDRFITTNAVHRELMRKSMAVSIQRSVLGSMISKYLVLGTSPEIALISGLVSQLGHTVIIKYIDDDAKFNSLAPDDIENILAKYGDEVSDLILCMWGFPKTIIEALFGQQIANTTTPTTNHDVVSLAQLYIENPEKCPMAIYITEMLNEHPDEYESTKSLFAVG